MRGAKNTRTSRSDASPKVPNPSAKRQQVAHVTFDQHYQSLYGARWPTLRAAMLQASPKVALWNKFNRLPVEAVFPSSSPAAGKDQGEGGSPQPSEDDAVVPIACNAFPLFAAKIGSSSRLLDQPPRDDHGVPAYYLFDYASALIVEQLQVEPVHRVLDLCAAPGGKSIAIAQRLGPNGSGGELTSNEAKKDRCVRLRRNLAEHFGSTAAVLSNVTQREATTWHTPETYDRVLVDAPCSSERHLLSQPGGTADWALQNTHEISTVQRTLLLRALEAVKVGGRVVYSTCSISPVENDEVIAFALARTRCHVELAPTTLRVGQATDKGWLVLPDNEMIHDEKDSDEKDKTKGSAAGWGPMYCATLVKVGSFRPMDPSSSSSSDSEEEEIATPE